MKREQFYTKIKTAGLFKKLSQAQVDSFEALLNECENQAVIDPRQVAYLLATVYHETAFKMQPVEEIGKGQNRTYGHRVWYSGKPYFDVDFIYYGRGFTQTSWRDNYRALSRAVARSGYYHNFEFNPSLLLNTQPSAWASVYAMRTGLYTGRKLSQYFGDTLNDPIAARRIINGKDKAIEIAGYYEKFLTAII